MEIAEVTVGELEMKHYLETLKETICGQWGDIALSDYRGKDWTYGEMARVIAGLHLAYAAAGVSAGGKIALCGRNSASWAIAYIGTVSSGNVVVPILPNFTPEGIENLVAHSDSEILLVDEEIAKTLNFEAFPRVKVMVSIEGLKVLKSRDDVARVAFDAREELVEKAYPSGFKAEDVKYPVDNEGEIAVINYTSGTTSAPKGVMLRHGSFSATMEFAQKRIPAGKGDHIVSMLPMAHMYGLSFELLYPLISGVNVHYLGKAPSPSMLMAAMRQIRPYIVITVPLVMEKIYKSSVKPALSRPAVKALLMIPGVGQWIRRKAGKKLLEAFGGNVRHFIMGGAPLNPEAEACFRKIGLPYTVGYGMTEACPLLAYEDWKHFAKGSCGKPVDCAHVRIDSADPYRVVGEIQAKGENICVGYFKNPEATKAAFTEDGYLRTGDLGRMDRKGNLYICGRSKNLILSATGQNIYPEEIEALVNQQDYVAESVVVGREMRLVALVYLDEDALRKAGVSEEEKAAIPERIRKVVNEGLPAYSKLSQVELHATAFEKTPKMSIKRFLYS